jgi:hypothetical protein
MFIYVLPGAGGGHGGVYFAADPNQPSLGSNWDEFGILGAIFTPTGNGAAIYGNPEAPWQVTGYEPIYGNADQWNLIAYGGPGSLPLGADPLAQALKAATRPRPQPTQPPNPIPGGDNPPGYPPANGPEPPTPPFNKFTDPNYLMYYLMQALRAFQNMTGGGIIGPMYIPPVNGGFGPVQTKM